MKKAWRCWRTTINLALIVAIPMLIYSAFSHRATAEDPGACFMITSSGKTVRLANLCGATVPSENDSRVFRVPIKRRLGGTPIIDVTFNEKQTFEMIMDTGATGTVITQGMASTLQLQSTGTMQAQIADGSLVQFFTGNIKSIAVGGATANNLQVAIAPKAGIGLLGHDFFGNYDIKILEKEVEFKLR